MSAARNSAPVAIIADDEDLGRTLLAEAAAASGLEPCAFDNGAAALEAALSQDVALVLLDVNMPGLDGYAVCRRLRADPRFTTVPIVMVTGQDDSEAIDLAFEAGATDFVAKPVNWALLPRRLDYMLRNASAAERIERLAYYDPLTGLPNRRRCLETAERLMSAARDADESVAIVYLDLNSFKRINDTFGHSVGDSVLRIVADKLSAVLGRFAPEARHVSVGRFGGDEFLVLVQDARARALAVRLAEECCAAFARPVVYDGLELYCAPSVGVALFPEHGADVATVLKHADTAMYHAKADGIAAVTVYAEAMSNRLRDWLDLEARLRRAVQEDRLALAFQPKFRLCDGRLAGVEALLRWRDAEHGEVAPQRFIEIAEESGLILELGAWLVRAVCRQLRTWIDRRIAVPVAINLSGLELLHGDPAEQVEKEAAAAGVPTNLIEIEMTESVLVKDSAAVRSALERFRRLGCRIALDDFGTGYSSLAYITRFPPDRIKIDKAFVREVDRSASDAAIANAVLSLGASLGLTVTAEGVERPGQYEWLRSRGCDEVQGYLLSRPVSAQELEERFLVEFALPPAAGQDAARSSAARQSTARSSA
ncbi:MAG TPA: EAL domain-containing protein [Steroidobacteraceae bacterium]|nr:EAL domain-containing protein [Steroidobacteraceae bacterium]